ncbi:protein Flattop [Trichomycterus rosablanca]|uniref:protein Flattop n=1 Tax=Trichomycterus rosablanca TaxID=2290929 RepID=UPI002F35E08D
MSSSFSANQYDSAFKSNKLQNWTQPKSFKERPSVTQGHTTFIATDQGHLLSDVKRGSAWSSFKGTWDLPKRIPPVNINPTARSQEGQERLRAWSQRLLSSATGMPSECYGDNRANRTPHEENTNDNQLHEEVSAPDGLVPEMERPVSQESQASSRPATQQSQVHSRPASQGRPVESRPASQHCQANSRPASQGRPVESRPASQQSQAHSRPASQGRPVESRPASQHCQANSRPASQGRPVESRPASQQSQAHSRPASQGRQVESRPASQQSRAHSRPTSQKSQAKSEPTTQPNHVEPRSASKQSQA